MGRLVPAANFGDSRSAPAGSSDDASALFARFDAERSCHSSAHRMGAKPGDQALAV